MARRAWVGVMALALGCNEFGIRKPEPEIVEPPPECEFVPDPPGVVPINPLCAPVEAPVGGFVPVTEWTAGPGRSCRGTPAVGDLDGDGLPEVVANFSNALPGGTGSLEVLRGDGTGTFWRKPNAGLGYGSAIALGDIDGDGLPEIVTVRKKSGDALSLTGTFAVVAWDAQGNELWESPTYPKANFDYATGVVLADMDHDGEVEVVAGRVILRGADGTERGVGKFGRGSWGGATNLSESSYPAVADLDLDGEDEVIVGNAAYDADGNAVWSRPNAKDGMIAIADLDDDPMGEAIVSSGDSVRAIDTDGRTLWGPIRPANANIVSNAAVGDIDGDGRPEIVIAGGNQLLALNHDGTQLWSADVIDQTGATGASIFDFEGDGLPEVVYIDETAMYAFDGPTGVVKFFSNDHGSDTLFDYPVIADVDGDDNAEIVVCHAFYEVALSVYGDRDASWRPARPLWNQHAYAITNVRDDLTIPPAAFPPWRVHNSWHAAGSEALTSDPLFDGPVDVAAELLGFCDSHCAAETEVTVFGRLINAGPTDVPAGAMSLSLYAVRSGARQFLGSAPTTTDVPSGTTGGDVTFVVPYDLARFADDFVLVADDEEGVGLVAECVERNNEDAWGGPLCLGQGR
jgi:hypothetical protein